MNQNQIIIAVDFDGTCVVHKYPFVGEDVPHASRVLLRLQDAGVKIILYTMRSNECSDGNMLEQAVEWFNDKGIKLYGINENPTQKYWTSSPKVYAHLYIDDGGIGTPTMENGFDRPFVDWKKVEKILEGHRILKQETKSQ